MTQSHIDHLATRATRFLLSLSLLMLAWGFGFVYASDTRDSRNLEQLNAQQRNRIQAQQQTIDQLRSQLAQRKP